MENCFSDCDPAQPEGLLTERAADLKLHNTRTCMKRFLTVGVETKELIVIPKRLPNHFQKEQILLSKSTATKR